MHFDEQVIDENNSKIFFNKKQKNSNENSSILIYSYAIPTSNKLLITCFPTSITNNWIDNSARHPLASH